MPFEPEKTSFVPDRQEQASSFEPEGPSALGAAKQFLIGAVNSATFSVPELVRKEDFDKLESPYTAERIARGAGTVTGAVVGLPGLAFKVGSKVAMRGVAKTAPKLVRLANIAERAREGTALAKAASKAKFIQAMVEGAGGAGLYNAVDPNTPLEDKPKSIAEGMIGGAVVGATIHTIPKSIKAIINKSKRVPKKTAKALNEAVKPPSTFTPDGQEINPNPRADLVPSYKRMVPKEAKNLVEDLENRQTEILAADRGILSAKVQNEMSKSINAEQVLNNWKAGQVVNTETMFAVRNNLADRVMSLPKNPTPEMIENLSKDFIKADAMASEAARTVGALNKVQSMASDQLKMLTETFSSLDPQASEAAKRIFKQFKAPGFWDKFMEYRTASLLSSPFAHFRNIIGNTIPRLVAPTEKTVAGLANKAESLFTGKPQTVFAREGLADMVGVYHGTKPAIRNAIKAFMNEDFVSQERLAEAITHGKAISGLKGKIIRMPFRALGAMDEFFATLGKHASLYSQATRQAILEKAKDIPARTAELVKNPSHEMIARAAKEALVDTFRQPLGPAANHIQKALNAPNPVSRTAKIFIPFFRTPVNLFKWTSKRTPGIGIIANWKPLIKGTAEQRAEAIGKLALGQVISAGMVMQAMDGSITGRLSGKKEERELLMRQGIQPYSIKIGDKYVSYRSFEPISSWLAMMANAVEVAKDDGVMDENKAAVITMETIKMMKDQSFLRGISDITNALDDPERYGSRLIQNLATSGIPTGVGYLARLQDPVLKEPNSIPDAVKAKLPYFTKQVPDKLDVWGRPITKEGTLLQRALLPSGVMTEKPDLTESELLSLENFPRKINKKYRGVELNVWERNLITRSEGRITKPLIDAVVRTPEYQQMTPEQQSQTIDKIFYEARKAVRVAFTNKKRIQALREAETMDEKIKLIEKYTNKILIKR